MQTFYAILAFWIRAAASDAFWPYLINMIVELKVNSAVVKVQYRRKMWSR